MIAEITSVGVDVVHAALGLGVFAGISATAAVIGTALSARFDLRSQPAPEPAAVAYEVYRADGVLRATFPTLARAEDFRLAHGYGYTVRRTPDRERERL